MQDFSNISDESLLKQWELLHNRVSKRSYQPGFTRIFVFICAVLGPMFTLAFLYQTGLSLGTLIVAAITAPMFLKAQAFENETKQMSAERDALQAECVRRNLL